MKQKSSCFK